MPKPRLTLLVKPASFEYLSIQGHSAVEKGLYARCASYIVRKKLRHMQSCLYCDTRNSRARTPFNRRLKPSRLHTMDKLSDQDKVILDTIFDPLQPLGINSNPSTIFNEVTNAEEDTDLSDEIRDQLKQAILLAESRKFDEAFTLFEKLRDEAPESASILNDRAQALRLAGRDQEALEDLTLAIKYSNGKGKAGVQALCQRGALYRYLGKDNEAKEDFTKAADGGSNFAKSQLVAMNPYAAMCNAMLQKITMNIEQD